MLIFHNFVRSWRTILIYIQSNNIALKSLSLNLLSKGSASINGEESL